MRLKDIAEEAGVSISTVSRVISGKNLGAASPELRSRILSIAENCNYVQNSAAHSLRCAKSENTATQPKIVACLFARTQLRDQFFEQMSRSINEYFIQHNSIVKYTLALRELTAEYILKVFSENHLDGVIVLGRCDSVFIETLQEIISNIMLVSLNPSDSSTDQVVCSGFDAGAEALQHLFDLGHRKIGYIGDVTNELRYLAYNNFMCSHPSLSLTQNRIIDTNLTARGGYDGLTRLIKNSPDTTAVFCANDTTAMGALKASKDLGLSVPGDLSIVGVDDIEVSRYLAPMLTTVQIPIVEMGKMAAKILLDRIDGGHVAPVNIAFPSRLIPRESTGKL